MLLVLDVGNTNIVFGIYEERTLRYHWRISTVRHKTADEYAMVFESLFRYNGLGFSDITAVTVSSVVPPLTPVLETLCRRYMHLEPLVIGPGIKTGMPIRFDNPREVGADRIVNAVAAYHQYGGPSIVVDFGTATTFDAISARGEYLGGAISPGMIVSAEALFQAAAKLPRIELFKPATVIGKTTVSGMQAGIMYGYIALVEGLVTRIRQELGGKAFVVATGGLARLIAEGTVSIDRVDPFLTLEGLRAIYDMNKDKS